MSGIQTAVGAAMAATLLAMGISPTDSSGSGSGSGRGSDVVTVVSLTDHSGDLTPAAEAGRAESSQASSSALAGDLPAILTTPTETEEFVVAGLTWDPDTPLTDDTYIFLRVLEGDTWSEWLEVDADGGLDGSPASGTDPFITGGAVGVQAQVLGDAARIPSNLRLHLIPADADGHDLEVYDSPGDRPQSEPDQDLTVEFDESLVDAPQDVESNRDEDANRDGEVDQEDDGSQDEDASQGDDATTQDDDVNQGDDATTQDDDVNQEDGADQGDGADRDEGQEVEGGNGAAGFAGSGVTGSSLVPQLATSGLQPMSPNLPQPTIQTRAQWGADESLMRWTPQPRALRAAVVHHTAGTNNYTQAQAPGVVRGIYIYHATQRDGNGWGDIGYNFLVDRFGRIYEGRTGSRTAQPGQMTQGAHALGFNNGTLGISVMGNYSSMNASSTVLNSMANVIAWQFSRAGIAVDTRSGMISPGSPTRPAGQNLPRIFGHRDVSNTTCPGRIQNQLGTIRNLVRTKMPTLYRLNNTFTGSANYSYYFGARNAEVFVGDWNGDGIDTPAVRVGNRISINNSNSYSSPDQVFTYGRASDELFVGDWNGDGRDTFALRRDGIIYIRNTFGGSASQVLSKYGRANDRLLVGDWNGNGRDTFAIRRGGTFYLRNTFGGATADQIITNYGQSSDDILVGDWNSNGRDTFAIRRGTTFYFRNTFGGGASAVQTYGLASDVPIAGDWNGNGSDRIGIYRTP